MIEKKVNKAHITPFFSIVYKMIPSYRSLFSMTFECVIKIFP